MQPCEQAVSKTYLATEGLEVIFFQLVMCIELLVLGPQKPQRDAKGLRVQ